MRGFRSTIVAATLLVSLVIQYLLRFDKEQIAIEILLAYVVTALLLMGDVPGAIWRFAIDWRARRRARPQPLPAARVRRSR